MVNHVMRLIHVGNMSVSKPTGCQTPFKNHRTSPSYHCFIYHRRLIINLHLLTCFDTRLIQKLKKKSYEKQKHTDELKLLQSCKFVICRRYSTDRQAGNKTLREKQNIRQSNHRFCLKDYCLQRLFASHLVVLLKNCYRFGSERFSYRKAVLHVLSFLDFRAHG